MVYVKRLSLKLHVYLVKSESDTSELQTWGEDDEVHCMFLGWISSGHGQQRNVNYISFYGEHPLSSSKNKWWCNGFLWSLILWDIMHLTSRHALLMKWKWQANVYQQEACCRLCTKRHSTPNPDKCLTPIPGRKPSHQPPGFSHICRSVTECQDVDLV